MLLAWADDSCMQEYIMELDTMEAISNFFRNASDIVFVIDRMNALEESDSGGSDSISNQQKRDIHQWLYSCVANQRSIFSTSSNYTTYLAP